MEQGKLKFYFRPSVSVFCYRKHEKTKKNIIVHRKKPKRVRKVGFEPTREYSHWILRPAPWTARTLAR
jgi:hypothetical protein